MPLRFDAANKDLVETFVPDYQAQFHLEEFGSLRPVNVDLSTVSAASDVVLGHGDPFRRLIDLNFQSGPDDTLVARLLLYNALLYYHYGVPVHSLLILLRPISGHAEITGRLRYEGRKRKSKMDFTFEVIRLWQQPVQRYLRGGLGTLPLAPLCQLPAGKPLPEALAPVIRQIDERLATEASAEDRATLLTATYILLGLRVPKETARSLLQGVQAMKESSTYQGIIEEGEAQGEIKALQKTLLRLGQQRFGKPSPRVKATLQGVTDLVRLEHMTDRILTAAGWQDLLETQSGGR